MLLNLNKSTLREQILLKIRMDILQNRYKVGEKINEVSLSKKYGISRGPIREALRQIEQEGLVEYIPNKGCTVTALKKSNVYESSIIRGSLECLAIEMAQCKFTEKSMTDLEISFSHLSESCNAKDIEKVIYYDGLFHEFIVKNAESQKLYSMWKSMDAEMSTMFYMDFKNNFIPYEIIKENHHIILESLKTNDVEYAKVIVKKHYMGCYDRWNSDK